MGGFMEIKIIYIFTFQSILLHLKHKNKKPQLFYFIYGKEMQNRKKYFFFNAFAYIINLVWFPEKNSGYQDYLYFFITRCDDGNKAQLPKLMCCSCLCFYDPKEIKQGGSFEILTHKVHCLWRRCKHCIVGDILGISVTSTQTAPPY